MSTAWNCMPLMCVLDMIPPIFKHEDVIVDRFPYGCDILRTTTYTTLTYYLSLPIFCTK